MPIRIGSGTRSLRDMVRAGVSLPALMQLMGHADIRDYTAVCAKSRRKTFTSSIRAQWRSWFGRFRGSRHEAHRASSRLQHPLAPVFDRAIDSICTALGPESRRQYQGTVIRNFLRYLGTTHPEVTSLEQLQRDPHLLGWMSCLRSQTPPLATSTYILRLIILRPVLDELAWTEQLPHLARLIRREDIPRQPATTCTPAHDRAGSASAAGVRQAQRCGSECVFVDPLYRHAHRRMCRFIFRLPALNWSRSAGHSRAARQTPKRTHGPGGFIGSGRYSPLTLLSLPRSATSGWPPPGQAHHQEWPGCATPSIPSPCLSLSGPFNTYSASPDAPYLRHRDASRRR